MIRKNNNNDIDTAAVSGREQLVTTKVQYRDRDSVRLIANRDDSLSRSINS